MGVGYSGTSFRNQVDIQRSGTQIFGYLLGSLIQAVSTKFQYFFHDFSMTKALKLITFLHASWHERGMYQGHNLRPVLPLRIMHKVLVTNRKMRKTPKFDLNT